MKIEGGADNKRLMQEVFTTSQRLEPQSSNPKNGVANDLIKPKTQLTHYVTHVHKGWYTHDKVWDIIRGPRCGPYKSYP